MAKKNLVIVESPAKAKTIEKFLGKDYEVRASMGHVLDLPKNGLGINTRKDFAPKYELIDKKGKVIEDLKQATARSNQVYLASDPDREGEFIAWSLDEVLKLKAPRRVVFNEITKQAVQTAIQHPRKVDQALVNAQQARRFLDRLVGYKISPLLWRRIQAGTSAGRVQSVALRLICDREEEIRNFASEEYWSLTAHVSKPKERRTFPAELIGYLSTDKTGKPSAVAHLPRGGGKQTSKAKKTEPADPVQSNGQVNAGKSGEEKFKLRTEQETNEVITKLTGASYRVLEIEEKEVKRQPYLPYTTSTMQQEASNRIRMKPKRTMQVAQSLYEGIELGDIGYQGLITYMRTDSTRVSEEAQAKIKDYITGRWGKDYVGANRISKSKANIQDAHEAIRPTDVTLTPESIKKYLKDDEFKLYKLIWLRFVASFMAPAIFTTIRVDIGAAVFLFRAAGSTLRFKGFYEVWPRDDEEETLPLLQTAEVLDLHKLDPQQHFTQPPPRYNEASLIKELEERGIGRPSTYVPIVTTIQDRGYVEQDQRRFVPTWLGETVNEMMTKHFPDIVDTNFTAGMEHQLDQVEEGKEEWISFLHKFYSPFKVSISRAEEEMNKVQKPVEETDEHCPQCGRILIIKMGRFGRFISCSGFPECTYRTSLVVKTGARCPKDNGEIVERKTKKKGRKFYGCANYPTCDFATWDTPVALPCPYCHGLVVIPQNKKQAVCTACERQVELPAPDQKGEQEPVGANQTATIVPPNKVLAM